LIGTPSAKDMPAAGQQRSRSICSVTRAAKARASLRASSALAADRQERHHDVIATRDRRNAGTDIFDGAFSEYAVISRKSLIKVDPELDLVHAALFGCAVVTGVGAVTNTCQVRPGESVVVVGLGGVGLASILGAAAVGADPIIAVDMIQSKLDLALQLGATHAFLASDPDIIAKVKDVTRGGARHVLERLGQGV
jgi:alcohol dehydrogenase